MNSRLFAGLLVASLTLVACGGGGSGQQASSAKDPTGLSAETASFDLAAGPPSRYLIGLFTNDQRGVSFGSIQLQFCFLGETKVSQPCRLSAPVAAAFLPTPGTQVPPDKTAPEVISPAGPKGVYEGQAGFDRAGIWQTHVTATVDGRPRQADTSFEVLERHAIPAAGDAAIPSDNLTVSTPGVSPASVDSRASAGGLVPDPELHQTTIAAAIAAHRPALVVFSTPVYCISRFCGPITDMVDDLAKTYADRASFIHVEIWKDYQQQVANKAATDWLFRNDNLNEPWVFLIGADGKIVARWDNVSTKAEIEPFLQQLPVIGRG
ncbi:MAG: hypothetical protein JO265_14470 [Acidimicrobiia bacterium]|nr:hypothetical protein [Acidimicrobiia bacterium]